MICLLIMSSRYVSKAYEKVKLYTKYCCQIHRIAATRAQSNDVTVPAGDYFAWSKTIRTISGTETQYNGIPGALLMVCKMNK